MFSSVKIFNFEVNFLFVAVFCLLVIYDVAKKLYLRRFIGHYLPVAYGLPFIGVLYKIVPVNGILKTASYEFKRLNTSSVLTWIGPVPAIITMEPDIIKRILNSDQFLNKAKDFYHTLDKALPDGILTSSNLKWKHDRKLINPLFTPQILKQFKTNFNSAAKEIALHFESLSDGKEHAVLKYLKQTFLKVAIGTTIGAVPPGGEKRQSVMIDNFNSLIEKVLIGVPLAVVNLSFLIRTPGYHKSRGALKSYMENLIKTKLESDSSQEVVSFLDRILKYEEQKLFTRDDILMETFTMLMANIFEFGFHNPDARLVITKRAERLACRNRSLALALIFVSLKSFETSAITLHSLITMLAMHQDVQQKLYQEIMENIGDSEDMDSKYFDELPYLNMVIEETMRLMPPIPIIGRQSLESCNLTPDIKLPKDFQILILIFHLHRQQDLWGPNADRFNPDNFLPENVEKRHPYAYLPFSNGARGCVGRRYAQNALKVLAVNVVREFQFFTEFPFSKLEFISDVTLKFLTEPKIRFVKRST